MQPSSPAMQPGVRLDAPPLAPESDVEPMKLCKRIAFTAILALAILAMAEALLRWATGPPPPPTEVHQVSPPGGSYLRESSGEVSALFQPRRTRQAFPVQASAPRFAVLGGSSVFEGGLGVGPQREFPKLLAQRSAFEGVNLGAPGLDSFDLLRICEELLQWSFQAVVVYAGHNDLGNAFFQKRYQGAGVRNTRGLLERLRLYTALRARLAPDRLEGPGTDLLTPQRRSKVREQLRANLQGIADLTRSHGVPLVLVVPVSRLTWRPQSQPCQSPDCPDQIFDRAMELQGRDPKAAGELLRRARDLDAMALRADSQVQQLVRDVAADEGAILADAAALLPRDPQLDVPRDGLFTDFLHFSPDGHQAMAALISPLLEDLAREEPAH